MTDVALNHYPGTIEIADLADSPEFHAACQKANQLFPYPITSWTPPLARKALSDTRLSQLYLERQVRAATARLKVEALPHEWIPDFQSTVQTFWGELAVGYRPGTIIDGELVTWGYEAYMAVRLTPMVASTIASALRWSRLTRSTEEEGATITVEIEEDRWEGLLHTALVTALDELLTDEDLRAAYFDLAYTETSMGEIASSTGLSYHLLHARLLAPLCRRLAKAASREMNGHVRFCTGLRTALAEVLPVTDFAIRYPIPAPHESEPVCLPQPSFPHGRHAARDN